MQTAAVQGKVTHDGQAVSGGSITFRPIAATAAADTSGGGVAGKPASGMIQSDGSYQLGTYKETDGAVVGKHEVMFSPPEVEPAEPLTRPDQTAPVSPYAGLEPKQKEVEVQAGSNEINIELVPRQGTGPRP